jgi:tetratricopeptide (TPR) repeat protein
VNAVMSLRRYAALLVAAAAALLWLPAAAGQERQQSQEIGQGEEPAWVLYEMGRARQADEENPEPGEALYLYRRALEKQGVFPEAEMAIGDIYFAENALELAEEQYKRAYEDRNAFLIPQQKYLLLYRLAALYDREERFGDMEKQLRAIVQQQPAYAGDPSVQLTDAVRNAYLSKGLDSVFVLYRMSQSTFATAAHARLGWLDYRNGHFTRSITHLLFALDIVVTEAVQEIRSAVPDYAYTSLESFVAAGLQRPAVRAYLEESSFFEVLYYLSTATFAASAYPRRAQEIWRFLSSLPPGAVREMAGPYVELARRQLQEPWVDPYINPSPRFIEYPQ